MAAARTTELAGLHWRSDGCATLSGALLGWARSLDAHLLSWADDMDAAEHRFPALIPASHLAPVGYLQSFPQLATFATFGRRDPVALRSIAERHGGSSSVPLDEETFEEAGTLLTPAACYHFYPLFAGSRLSAPLRLTTCCQCFRREDEYLPLQRQWSFEMREFVCIGDGDAIRDFADMSRRLIDRLLDQLGLDAGWETASDPFFDPQSDPKALAQLIEPVKEELCTPDGLAIASFNKHRGFFAESYDIRINDRPARSACVAFGIERWIYSMLQAHGADAARWPVPGSGS